jgi:hypothetical protein
MQDSSVQEPTPQPRKNIRRSRAQWEALMKEFEASGQTRHEFCEIHNIPESSFYKWRTILTEKEKTSSIHSFVELTPPSEPEQKPEWDLELAIGQHVTLRIKQPQ